MIDVNARGVVGQAEHGGGDGLRPRLIDELLAMGPEYAQCRM